jgi:hypothetical protein
MIFSPLPALPFNLELRHCSGLFTKRTPENFLRPTSKLLKFAGDEIPSPGHSGEDREWKQIKSLTIIQISVGSPSAFFAVTEKWNLTFGKSRLFGDWS